MRGPRRPLSLGRAVLNHGSERAIDSVLAGPLPEAVARSLIEHHVLERVASEVLSSDGAVDEARLEQIVDDLLHREDVARLVEGMTEMVVGSPAFRRAVMEILADPAFRRSLTRQATGFGAELGAAVRSRLEGWDETFEATAHRVVRRSRDVDSWAYGGFATRGLALVVDAALAQLGFLIVLASVALVASLVGAGRNGPVVATLIAVGWLLAEAVYFTAFWSATGQTPGMRFMRLRVVTADGTPPSLLRSLARVVGLFLAIVTLFAGFLPALVDRRRRALPDYLAGTVVLGGVDPIGESEAAPSAQLARSAAKPAEPSLVIAEKPQP